MSEERPDREHVDAVVEQRLRNLQAVAQHLQTEATHGRDAASSAKPKADRGRSWGRWGPVGIALAFLLGKGKLVLGFLKFAKVGTLLSMVVAIWVYATIWGAPFAVGFVLLIFVHELGHALMMRHLGIPAGAPVFIPFVGAVIAMRGIPRNAWVESLVGIGGPLLGSVGALICFVIGWATGSLFWYALASTGFLINLFNLLPISPLDGGRIVGVISRWLWLVGYAVGIGMFLVTYHPLVFLILLFGLFSLGRTIRGPTPDYYETPNSKRIAMGVAYFGLAAFLAVAMWESDQHLETLPVEQRTAMVAVALLSAILSDAGRPDAVRLIDNAN